MTEKTTATVKNGIAYFEGNSFTLSNIDKVKILDYSRYTTSGVGSLRFTRSDKNLIISFSGTSNTVTINDYFNEKGAVVSSVKTIRAYAYSEKKRYKDYDLVSSGLLNAISSGVTTFDIKNGVITGTAFADTISAVNYEPTGKNKDTGVTVKTGSGNDDITGSEGNDTFNINGSGIKIINIKSTDGDDIIKGINTENASVVLNLSNTVLDTAANAAKNATYERVGNDLKITASETVPTKIDNLSDYIWYKEYKGYDSISGKYIYNYCVTTSDTPPANYYIENLYSFSAKPLYSYQDGNETKYTEYRDATCALGDAYLLTGYNAYDGNNYTPDGNIVKLFTSEEAANAYKASYYDEDEDQYYGGHDTCEIIKLSDLEANDDGKKILYSYKKRSYNSYYDTQVYSKDAPTYNDAPVEPVKYSDMYLHDTGSTYYSYSNGYIKRYILKTEAEKTDEDIKISDLDGSIFYREDGYFYTENPYYNYKTEIPKTTFDTTYYLSPELILVSDYKEYDIDNTYYTYNEQNYQNKTPDEITGKCIITESQAPEYKTVDSIYSYVNDGSMAYSLDAQTANYREDAEKPASSTTTIKDYFKNTTAPNVNIGTKNVKLIDALNKTELVNIDRQHKLNKDGSVKLDKNNNPVIQTGKQTINGTFLNDVITGGQGADTINLGKSDNTTGDRIDAGKGNDTINIKGSGKKIITIDNEDGNDIITGTNTSGAKTYLNFTDAQSNLEYIKSSNNLVIKRTYEADGSTKTSTTTIKNYFKDTSSTPNIYLGDGSGDSVALISILSGFDAGVKGTHLNDNLKGTDKADKITTGKGEDTIVGGKGNDTITIDGANSKYIVMNTGDGTDTVNIKNTSASTYIQFKGAEITDSDNVKTNLIYEKSGKNDLKISYTDSTMQQLNNFSGLYFYDKYGQDDFIIFTKHTKYSESSSYFTEISNTGLYSYENEGKTCYSTNKTETVALNTVYFETDGSRHKNGIGYLTTTPHTSEYTDYNTTALNGVSKIYAYKNTIAPTYTANGKQATEIIYTTDSTVTPTSYSDLWLKPVHNDHGGGWVEDYYLLVTTKENDDCIKVSDQDALYWGNSNPSYSSDERIYLTNNGSNSWKPFITKDEYDSVYYFDIYHSYITDIDDNSKNGICKEYNVADSYFLAKNGKGNDVVYLQQGNATSKAISASDYTQITTIYSTKDADGNYTYSAVKPKDFDTGNVETSVIIKDYLTETPYVYINDSNSSDHYYLRSILNDIGLTIGDANSKKAQTLTGTKFNDNIYGGSGKDKITTGESDTYRGDVINPGAGDDTITIDGKGKKTINIANKDGNDTIIFTDNDKKTTYDYNTNKMLYLNFDNSAEITYDMKGKDLVISRSYAVGSDKTESATTTLKDYFNVDYKYDLAENIYINSTKFYPTNYFNNTEINKSVDEKGKTITKAQTINGNMFDNTIKGGSGNDTINGYGGSDKLNGGNGSDTYIVNYNKDGSKHYYYDKITISDSGEGANDVDNLKLDVKKEDMILLFNIRKISDASEYSANDIIVGSGESEKHYSMDNQLMVFHDYGLMGYVYSYEGNVVSDYGIVADGLEKITTSDKKTVTLSNIREIAQDVANWLSTANEGSGFDNTAAAFNSGFKNELLAVYNPDNTAIKEHLNQM